MGEGQKKSLTSARQLETNLTIFNQNLHFYIGKAYAKNVFFNMLLNVNCKELIFKF